MNQFFFNFCSLFILYKHAISYEIISVLFMYTYLPTYVNWKYKLSTILCYTDIAEKFQKVF